jgi:biofilm PGA synthesis N-glycosyltransferase PgaC
MEFVLLGSLALLVYVYIGYPVVLSLLGSRRRCEIPRNTSLPSVSLYVPAHNESQVIAEKIRNSLELEYPSEALEIVVVSDGSTDGTPEIAQAAGGDRIRVRHSPMRAGKSALINRFGPSCRGDIVVFTDANAIFLPDAVKKLVRNFANPAVGCVVGRLRYVDRRTAVAKGEGLYFKYESLLKRLESRLGAVVAATGSIYAIRRTLLTEFAPDVANDFAHPILVAAAGYKVVFEPEAVALEKATAHVEEEFRRKGRIVTRGLTAVARYWRRCRMLHGIWGFCFVSHKLLRWFGWMYMTAVLVASIVLYDTGMAYRVLVWAQGLFYGLAILAWAAGRRRGRLVTVPFYFCMINLAALAGLVRFFCGERVATWESAATTR